MGTQVLTRDVSADSSDIVKAGPGTADKIAILADRASRRLDLWPSNDTVRSATVVAAQDGADRCASPGHHLRRRLLRNQVLAALQFGIL